MQIKTFAQLSKIADICRKKGIESIKITEDAVEFKLKEEIPGKKRTKKTVSSDEIESPQQPTEEELLFYSSAGIPDLATNGHG